MEKWRDVVGYEGLYQVSTLGRVKRLEHWKNQRTDRKYKYYKYRELPEKILAQSKRGKYRTVQLSKDRKAKTLTVHRLVAQAFIPNPNNYPEVNHKDCNGHNNTVDNLEWCDRKYNINYADRTAKAARSCSKKVQCVETGIIYDSGAIAALENNLHKSKISQVCTGKRLTTGGFRWRFV